MKGRKATLTSSSSKSCTSTPTPSTPGRLKRKEYPQLAHDTEIESPLKRKRGHLYALETRTNPQKQI